MKIILTMIVSVFLSFTLSFSQTTIPAGDVSGVWNLTGSPYNITGDITIPNGQTLTIEPGVTVNFQGWFIFSVQGRLLAIGTQTDTIKFTSANTTEGWRGIRFVSTPSSNDTSKFIYCSIRYGRNPSGTGDNALGGGMFIRNFSKVYIGHSYFANNSARWGGALQLRENVNIIIEYSTFANNYAEFSGAGIRAIDFSDPVIRYNKLYNNSVGSGGAAFYFYRSNALVMNNHIYGNTSTSSGGAASLDNSMPTFINNLITNNFAANGGALHFTTLSNAKIINNTFANNNATNGGALYFSLSSNPDFINNIFWGNNAPFGSQVYIANDNSDPNFYNCIVKDGTLGFVGPGAQGNYQGMYVNNINSDPLFTGIGEHPFNISDNSPAIDAGRPDTSGLNLPLYDFAGYNRIDNNIVDIGAYEYQSIIPVELSSITATNIDNTITIEWITITEKNNSGFEIVRASFRKNETTPLQEWKTIGFVKGAGTTTQIQVYSFIDDEFKQPGLYQYRIKQIDFDGSYEYFPVIEVDIFPPSEFMLYQNFPNPFNPNTKIKFSIPQGIESLSKTSLHVYDILGNEVATLINEPKAPGIYEVNFNASDLTSGVYFYVLRSTPTGGQAGDFISTNKMILLK